MANENAEPPRPQVLDRKRETEILKTMKLWNISYTGKRPQRVEDFLQTLRTRMDAHDWTWGEVRHIIPACLTEKARDWWTANYADLITRSVFQKKIRAHFSVTSSDRDRMDELKNLRQGQNESLTDYIVRFQKLVTYFADEPTEADQLELIYRNMRVEYQDRIIIGTFKTIRDLKEKAEQVK